jgi:hypothetical protein
MIFRGMFWSCLCVFLLGCMIKLYANSLDEQPPARTLYCIELKDGIPVLTSDGKPVLTEVTFANGTKIKTDGTVVKKDGTQFVLKEGECVNDSAEVSKPAIHNKIKK